MKKSSSRTNTFAEINFPFPKSTCSDRPPLRRFIAPLRSTDAMQLCVLPVKLIQDTCPEFYRPNILECFIPYLSINLYAAARSPL